MCLHNPHFTDEDTEALGSSHNLPQAILLGSGGARIQILAIQYASKTHVLNFSVCFL